MLSVQVHRNKAGKVESAEVLEGFVHGPGIENHSDWKTLEAAMEVAAALGDSYVAADRGGHVRPRYDVIRRPHVGDEVSYTFNGDSYPAGKVVSVSKGPTFRRVVTSGTGKAPSAEPCIFWRRGGVGESWVMNGTWHLIQGVHNERNPSF